MCQQAGLGGDHKGAKLGKAKYAAGPERLIHEERVDDARHAGPQGSSSYVSAAVVDNLQCKAECVRLLVITARCGVVRGI